MDSEKIKGLPLGVYTLVNVGSGKALAVAGGSKEDGARIIASDLKGDPSPSQQVGCN